MHFADVINRYDFIDNVVRNVTEPRFHMSATTLVSKTNIKAPEYNSAGIRNFVLGACSRREYPVTVFRLARILRGEKIDVLHAHHFDPNMIAWAATRLHPATRLVVGRHYSDDHHAYLDGLKRQGYLGAEALVHHAAARIVVPSTMIRDLLVGRQHVSASKVSVIPYAFDVERYRWPNPAQRARLRAELGIGDGFAFATVGRILPKKGHRYLLTALTELAADLPDAVWIVLGDGPSRGELEQGVRRAGLADRVRFLGWRTDALEVMAAADVIVQPTLQEAYSQVMVEALWMGTPLIITEVSGATDLLYSGRTGMLVPRADSPALARAIRTLHANPALRAALAGAARELVEAKLSLKRIIPLYEAVYAGAMTG